MSSPIDLLQKACCDNLSANSSLSDDGRTITLLGTALDAAAPYKLTLGDGRGGTKEVSYTLASIYLQLLNPSVLQYRKACEAGHVHDPVKILDKGLLSDYFFDVSAPTASAASAAPPVDGDDVDDDGGKDEDTMDMSDDDALPSDGERESVQFYATTPEEKRPRGVGGRDKEQRSRRGDSRIREKERSAGKHRRHRDGRQRSHISNSRADEDVERRRISGKEGGKDVKGGLSKASKAPITNEQLVANLSTIVDKRDTAKNKTSGNESTETTSVASEGAAKPVDFRQITPATATAPAPADVKGPSKEDLEKKEKEDREMLLLWLSPAGFQVDSPTVAAAIEEDRKALRQITALEIPVGDSASILRAGAGGEVFEKVGASGEGAQAAAATPPSSLSGAAGVKKRDFARALEIYHEVMSAEEKARRESTGAGGGKKKRPPPPPSPGHRGKSPRTGGSSSAGGASSRASAEGNPIIVVPNAMTSAITMINAGFFLGKDGVFVPRDIAMRNPAAGKRGGTVTIARRLNQRLGGREITYDIIDNPTTRLKGSEWGRVVAVVCQGARWQFKGWRYSDPVDLFSRVFGFYVGIEGAAVPNELKGWNVKIGKVSRDRRGLDNVCLASFWNGLEEFMAVHKQEFLRSSPTAELSFTTG